MKKVFRFAVQIVALLVVSLTLATFTSCSADDRVDSFDMQEFEAPSTNLQQVDFNFETLGYQEWVVGDCSNVNTLELLHIGDVDLSDRELLVLNCVELIIDGNITNNSTYSVLVVGYNSTVRILGSLSEDVYVYVHSTGTLIYDN